MDDMTKVEFKSGDLSDLAFKAYLEGNLNFYRNSNDVYFWSAKSENDRKAIGSIIDLEIFLSSMYQQKAVERVRLNEMPLDKYRTGVGYIHATGDEVKLENGEWVTEYEDDIIEDAPDCVYREQQLSDIQPDEYYTKRGRSR